MEFKNFWQKLRSNQRFSAWCWLGMAAIILLTLIGLLTLSVTRRDMDWMAFTGIATALGALATTFAVIAALGVATRDARWRDEEIVRNRLSDKLYVSSTVPLLTGKVAALHGLKKRFQRIDILCQTSRISVQLDLKEIIDSLGTIDLSRISSVHSEAGVQLAISKYQLNLILVMFPHDELATKEFELRRGMLAGNLKNGSSALDRAYNLLQKMVNDDLGCIEETPSVKSRRKSW